ncbi:MAG: hypothetical protein ACI4SR_03730 [Faecalibacillus sp.]
MKKVKLLLAIIVLLSLIGCSSSNKTVSTMNNDEDEEEKLTLNEYLYFNGYKFKLGGSLDLFVSQTHVKLDKKQYKAAKKATNSISGLYYKVDAILDEEDCHCKISVYIDTSDLDNIRIQGISMESDRGWVDLEPHFLSEPNLITCGFLFLNGYDIDKDTFAEMPEEYQKRAVKRKNKYTDKYDLRLIDGDFGIEIQFDSLREKSDKIYITYVNVTNKPHLAW